MRALIVYESMYGNTRAIADHIAAGMGDRIAATVIPLADATPALVHEADLLVCGAPTHVHGLSGPRSRRAAVEPDNVAKNGLVVEPGADGPGMREWLDALVARDGGLAAAFDTRIDAPALFTGRASKGIGRRLRRRGYALAANPTSFLVDKKSRLVAGQTDRAETWGAALAATAILRGARAT
jgi:hypothetical protein